MDYDTKVTGKLIRELRENQKRSQTVVADLATVARSHLSDIENGRKSPSIATLWRIAEALEIRISDLLRIVEERMLEYLLPFMLKCKRVNGILKMTSGNTSYHICPGRMLQKGGSL